jgi:hypothetical protein
MVLLELLIPVIQERVVMEVLREMLVIPEIMVGLDQPEITETQEIQDTEEMPDIQEAPETQAVQVVLE